MASEVRSTVVNYYEILNIPQDSPPSVIQKALDAYVASLRVKLNNPLTMRSASKSLNEIAPAIRQHLLSDPNARTEYDQQLATFKKKQTEQIEPLDDEGFDDMLERPFFFDQDNGYDTETPAFTLRQIATKLDEEWKQTYTWITDTSDVTHPFVGYLTYGAERKGLAKRIEKIIKAVSSSTSPRMDANEAIERCINILDPKIERPRVSILNQSFDGKTLYAGDFIYDLPAQTELILGHEDIRGCTFGTIESRTSWVTFLQGQTKVPFTLMPEGTDPSLGRSVVKVPLIFELHTLARDADHTAEIVVHMENLDPVGELPIHVQIHILPIPPRVIFEPSASQEAPAWAGTTRRGVPANVVVIPRNAGDEGLVPLVARISTQEEGASAHPDFFHANEPITLTIDTSKRSYGSEYQVVYNVDYSLTAGARGPTTLHVQGEILPTTWQSLLREKNSNERLGAGCIASFGGLILLGGLGAALAAHSGIAWLFFIALPIILAFATRPAVESTVAHIQRSGETSVRLESIPRWALWGIPSGVGLLLALICTLLSNTSSSFLIGALVGFALGFVLGFIYDKARPASEDLPSS